MEKTEKSLNQINSIGINILYVPYNTEKIKHACKSRYILECEHQVILLIITDDKKMVLFSCKSLSAVLKGIRSKNEGDLYCLNCFY